jgi:ribosomal protein S18 acetylase RimI-like enzyme
MPSNFDDIPKTLTSTNPSIDSKSSKFSKCYHKPSILTEQEFAEYRKSIGRYIEVYKDIYFEARLPGFWQPAALLRRCSYANLPPLTLTRWGVHVVLRQEDSQYANGSMSVHLLKRLQDYSVAKLKRVSRKEITAASSRYEIVVGGDVSKSDAYEVYSSTVSRTIFLDKAHPRKLKNIEEYRKYLEKHVYGSAKPLLLTAHFEEEIVGFIWGYVIDKTAYLKELYVHNEHHKYGVARLLYHRCLLILQELEGVEEVFSGRDWTERPGINFFKESMGFPLVCLPVYLKLNPLVRYISKKYFPHKLTRLGI